MESKRMAQGVVAKSGCTPAKASAQLPAYAHSYFYNVSNRYARSFYEAAKVSRLDDAFELQTPDNPLIMQCRHCIRFSLGYCVKNGGKKAPWREPLTLRLGDGREFRLEFDCQNCQMNVYGKKR
jgi:putative protease